MTTVKYDFKGKIALVTGAGRGIGRTIAKALYASGAVTYALSKTQANLDSLVNECPGIKAVCVDLTDWDTTRKAVTDIGPIDLLVNNAGTAVPALFLDIQPEHFDAILSVNVKAVINVSQVVAKGLIERKCPGAIVNVSSLAALRAYKCLGALASSKGALDQLTRTMALELGPHNIRVNSVNPTVVMTDIAREFLSKLELREPLITRTPMGRFAEEEEVARPVLFLLSDDASMMNGAFLAIDGGYLVH